jgi:hypothetical protein
MIEEDNGNANDSNHEKGNDSEMKDGEAGAKDHKSSQSNVSFSAKGAGTSKGQQVDDGSIEDLEEEGLLDVDWEVVDGPTTDLPSKLCLDNYAVQNNSNNIQI